MSYNDLSEEEKTRHEQDLDKAQANKLTPMPLQIVKTEIEKINEFFNSSPWMDLEYKEITHNKIRLYGSIDEKSYPDYDEIEIIFFFPGAISSVFYDLNWTTKKPFISLVTHEEFKIKAGLVAYNPDLYIFKLANEDETNNFIAASGIRAKLIKTN